MPRKTTYTVARCPDDDWENLIDAAPLEGRNRDDVWSTLENLEYFSNPWVVIIIKADKVSAKIFNNQESAQKFAKGTEEGLLPNENIFCVKGHFRSR